MRLAEVGEQGWAGPTRTRRRDESVRGAGVGGGWGAGLEMEASNVIALGWVCVAW